MKKLPIWALVIVGGVVVLSIVRILTEERSQVAAKTAVAAPTPERVQEYLQKQQQAKQDAADIDEVKHHCAEWMASGFPEEMKYRVFANIRLGDLEFKGKDADGTFHIQQRITDVSEKDWFLLMECRTGAGKTEILDLTHPVDIGTGKEIIEPKKAKKHR